MQTVFEIGIWNAWIFMVVFIIQMMIMMGVGNQNWEKSQIPTQAKRNKFEKHVGRIANVFWFIAMVYSIFLTLKIDTIWFYIGLMMILIGHILFLRATYDFITTTSNKVIITGAYRYSRHPLYLATFFILIGVGIATISGFFLLLTVFIIVFFHLEACIEERYCLVIFSDEYKKYINNVPRWIGIRK